MKLPRDVPSADLVAALVRLDYRLDRQRGSHMHLITQEHGEHHVVVPAHRVMKTGTLGNVLRQVAEHHGMTREELIERLEL